MHPLDFPAAIKEFCAAMGGREQGARALGVKVRTVHAWSNGCRKPMHEHLVREKMLRTQRKHNVTVPHMRP